MYSDSPFNCHLESSGAIKVKPVITCNSHWNIDTSDDQVITDKT